MELESGGDTNCNWCPWSNNKRTGKSTWRRGNQRTRGHHPSYSIIKIPQNTKKSPGDLSRLAVTQTSEESHHITLVWKFPNGVDLILFCLFWYILDWFDTTSKRFVDQARMRGCPRGVMVKAMNCGIVGREFVLQSRYYVHFRANTLGKGMNPLILPPAMGK